MMELSSWILMHTFYIVTSQVRLDDLKNDLRGVVWYAILCVALFSFWEKTTTAVAMSCVIACFFVICVVFHRIAMVYVQDKHYWGVFLILNNMLISATIYFYG